MAKNAQQFEARPWGSFEVLAEFKTADNQDVVIKKITVSAGKKLSYQTHQSRAEYWTVAEGRGQAILNDQTINLEAGSTLQIPKTAKHRISNTQSQGDLVFVEVAVGVFDENDIERLEDDFGRAQKS